MRTVTKQLKKLSSHLSVKFNEPLVLNPILKIVKGGILFSYVIYSYLIIFTPPGRVTGCSIIWTVGREFIELPQAEQTRCIKSI
jgi:hypothetical protein